MKQDAALSKDRVVLSWDEYFMGIALLSAFRSKDPVSGVGACVVNQRNRIVSVGYNGFPTGCSDDALPWAQEGDYLDTKYPYVCHAELNAILNSNSDLNNCRLYLCLFPCNECTKAIIQAGIREVIYLNYNKSPDSDIFIAARKLMDLAGVTYRRLVPKVEALNLSYTLFKEDELAKASGYHASNN